MKRIPEKAYHLLAEKRGFRFIGGYTGSVTKRAKWRCSSNHEWEANYSNIKKGHGCPFCAGKMRILEPDYHLLAEKRGFKFTGGWTGKVIDKVGWRCSDDHEWEASYNSVHQGSGCPVCAGNISLPEEDYYKLAVEQGLIYLGGWSGSILRKVIWQCENGHDFESPYGRVYQGHGCPLCSTSNGEKEIASILSEWNIEFVTQKRFTKCRRERPLPFDFYIPSMKILIEFQGRQHYVESDFFGGKKGLAIQQEKDDIKRKFAKSYNYHLIEISYCVEDITSFLKECMSDI